LKNRASQPTRLALSIHAPAGVTDVRIRDLSEVTVLSVAMVGAAALRLKNAHEFIALIELPGLLAWMTRLPWLKLPSTVTGQTARQTIPLRARARAVEAIRAIHRRGKDGHAGRVMVLPKIVGPVLVTAVVSRSWSRATCHASGV